jgi:hypothetical protein
MKVILKCRCVELKMADKRNPWEVPEWRAIGRECKLARHLLGSGVTALGQANYADKAGEYYNAFFGLAVGLERLAKLILVAHHAITHNGEMPEEKTIRAYGHKLEELMKAVDSIVATKSLALTYPRPSDEICKKIVKCIDSFADAKVGRYANFAILDSKNAAGHEPIGVWWKDVAEPILRKYYYGKPAQVKVEAKAKIFDTMNSDSTMVQFTNETGGAILDLESAFVRTIQTEFVQKYGRYHTLLVVRWLAEVFSKLADDACHKHRQIAFFGMSEFFDTYRVGDRFLKTRKIWPLR